MVGRPGLDPGTLGVWPDPPLASAVVQITWSRSSSGPPTSNEILANLVPWLHNWLHEVGGGAVGVMRFDHVGGESFELRIET